MKTSYRLLRFVGAALLLALALDCVGCSGTNSTTPNVGAGVGPGSHARASSPSAGVGPQGAGPAGSQ